MLLRVANLVSSETPTNAKGLIVLFKRRARVMTYCPSDVLVQLESAAVRCKIMQLRVPAEKKEKEKENFKRERATSLMRLKKNASLVVRRATKDVSTYLRKQQG